MATSNTQVTIYLPDHILDYVTKYCNEYRVVRKKDSKPLLATGIVDLLNVLVNIPIDELATAKQEISSIDIEGIIEKKLSDSKVIGNFIDTLLGDMAMVERLRDALSVKEKKEKTITSMFYRIKNGFLDASTILTTKEISKILECTVEQFETRKGLGAIQAHFLPHLVKRPDGTYSNRVYEILIDSEKDVMPLKEDKTLLDTLPVNEDKEDIVEMPIMPLNEELGTITPEEDKSPNKGEIELTEKQKEVMTNLDNIPSGEKLSYNSLAKTLGVTRTVLDSFELWKQAFDIEPKLSKKGEVIGNIYTKM